MIQLKNIEFQYNGHPVINNISLDISKGVLHGILGPNGAGKSTLLRIIAGLLKPDKGVVLINGTYPGKLSSQDRAKMVSMVFQETPISFPFTVQEVVLMGRHPYQDSFLFDTRKDLTIAEEVMREMDIIELRYRQFKNLSGGERQRVSIAAALAQRTKLLLLDEPTAFSDIKHQVEIYQLFHRISKEHDLTSVIVTHDINLASLFCDTISIISNGKILTNGSPTEVLKESFLRKVYGNSIQAIQHPRENTPIILPLKNELNDF
ncbi:MAG: ABC transporter ATP-binding protein [bacterium]